MKCTLTIEDTGPADLSVSMSFSRPIKATTKNTNATLLAIAAFEAVAQRIKQEKMKVASVQKF